MLVEERQNCKINEPIASRVRTLLFMCSCQGEDERKKRGRGEEGRRRKSVKSERERKGGEVRREGGS